MLNAGALRWWVDLSSETAAGVPVVMAPARVKARIQPAQPTPFDERRITHLVTLRYHAQITFETQMTYTDRAGIDHRLFVRGIQDVESAQREMALLCEEVVTP